MLSGAAWKRSAAESWKLPCQAQGLASKWPEGQHLLKDSFLCRFLRWEGVIFPQNLLALQPKLTHICFQTSFPC